MEHILPIIPIILPLIAAAIIVVINKPFIAWAVAGLTLAIAAFASFMLVVETSQAGAITYHMGGWQPPFGIGLYIDNLAAYVILLVTAIGCVLMPLARKSVMQEIETSKQPLFYALWLICVAGLVGMVATQDIFNLYVFLEISSLATYALIAMGSDRRALLSAFEYLILGTVGATFILIGVGFLYIMTGTLNMADLALRIPDATSQVPIQAAFAFITLGLALKIAMFPLHIWLTNAYAFAPNVISAFLAGTATKVSVYVLIRLSFDVFGYEFTFERIPFSLLFTALAIIGIVVGSVAAIYQSNIKRLLAFSSVAQLGYIILGFSIATPAGLAASVTHIMNHGLAKALLFAAVAACAYQCGGNRMKHVYGWVKAAPLPAICLVIGGLSLIGIPGTAGFISKWSFGLALLGSHAPWLALIVFVSSLLAIMYVWRLVEAMFFHEAIEAPPQKLPFGFVVTLLLLAVANIYFGFDTRLTAGMATDIAHDLFKAAP